MKKYWSFAEYYICLLCLLTLGAGILLLGNREGGLSEAENRRLQSFPRFSAASAADGSYMEDFEAFLSDAFPGRERLIGLSDAIMGVFGRADKTDEARKAVREEMGLSDDAPPAEYFSALPSGQEGEVSSHAEPEESPAGPGEAEAADAALWHVRADGRREIAESYSAGQVVHLAEVLNKYARALPAGGRVLFINAPASDFVNPVTDDHRYAGWGYDLDQAIEPLLDDNVRVYNALEIYEPYKDTEYLYSDTDFHWLIRTAWHVSDAFVEDLGYAPTDYYDYSYYLSESLKNGPYSPAQLRSMDVERGDLMIPLVNAPVEAWLVSRLTKKAPTEIYDFFYHKYSIYLGGAQGPYRLFDTGYHTGHNALVIADSFAFSMLYYLFPYYDNILQTDFRNTSYQYEQVGASVRRYMEEYDIHDVYFITCNWTSVNGSVFSWRAEQFLDTDFGIK